MNFQGCQLCRSQMQNHKTCLPCTKMAENTNLTLVLLKPGCPIFANSVDPDQLVSEKAKWSGSALHVIMYVNLYQKSRSRNLIGWQLEMDVTFFFSSAWQGLRWLVQTDTSTCTFVFRSWPGYRCSTVCFSSELLMFLKLILFSL